jgi:hypothetical protein
VAEADDQRERSSRAARLRERIARLKGGGDAAGDEPAAEPGESPRDFVARRMREESQEPEDDARP